MDFSCFSEPHPPARSVNKRVCEIRVMDTATDIGDKPKGCT